jgi:O-antigen ligase
MLYVYKSMRNKLESWRSIVLFSVIIIMMAALFLSRALLSGSVIVFVIVSFFHKNVRAQLLCFIRSPLLWGMSLLFFVPLLSGYWSADNQQWLDIIRIKLPLVFLPLAFAGYGTSFSFSEKQWETMGYFFVALLAAATCWSLFQYGKDPVAINESYLRAKAILTPLENDRIRFSWLVSVGIMLCGWLAVSKRNENKVISYLLAIIAVFFIVYLHILAVRTGLFSFYIMAIITIIWLLFKRLRWPAVLGLFALLAALPWIAYKTIPTFQNRLKYIRYDSGYFLSTDYWPSSNDATRVISLKAGWSIMNDHPLAGVGAGDMPDEVKRWYQVHYNGMLEADKIYPASEWLVYGSVAGWPGFLLFTGCMIIPFIIQSKNKLAWWLLNITAAFSFLFDIGLEVQFGVFIYSFFILWWYHWLNAKKV